MYPSIENKLAGARFFLNELSDLSAKAKSLASADPNKRRYYLDGFLFEIVAAKDMFLQEVNIKAGSPLKNWRVGEDSLLRTLADPNLKTIVKEIKNLKDDGASWLWRVVAYRNVTAHKAILGQNIHVTIAQASPHPRILRALFKKKHKSPAPSIHLAKDPNDPPQGSYPKEIIPYCENTLKEMKDFLEAKCSAMP